MLIDLASKRNWNLSVWIWAMQEAYLAHQVIRSLDILPETNSLKNHLLPYKQKFTFWIKSGLRDTEVSCACGWENHIGNRKKSLKGNKDEIPKALPCLGSPVLAAGFRPFFLPPA